MCCAAAGSGFGIEGRVCCAAGGSSFGIEGSVAQKFKERPFDHLSSLDIGSTPVEVGQVGACVETVEFQAIVRCCQEQAL